MAQRNSNRDHRNGDVEGTGPEGTEPEVTVETPEVEGTEGEAVETPVAEVEGTEVGTEVAIVSTEGEGAGDEDGQGDGGEPVDELAGLELTELTARMRDALNEADMELVQRLFALIDAKGSEQAATAPAAPKARTHTQVKRQVSQEIINILSKNLDTLIAGPDGEPYTDAEREVAKEKVANICGYLPYAAKLTWPENFADRTGRGMGRQGADSTEGDTAGE